MAALFLGAAWIADNPFMSTTRQELLAHFDGLLQPERFRTMVPTACRWRGAARSAASSAGDGQPRADRGGHRGAGRCHLRAPRPVLARHGWPHHGLAQGAHPPAAGPRHQSLAYHLPLDAHPQWGNNAQLGVQLGLEGQATFGEQNLGWMAAAEFADAAALGRHVEQALGRTPVCVGRAPHSPHSPHCMVHGRRARFLRGRDCRWGGCLHHGRDFRAAGAPGPGNGRGLSGGRPPCHGALWCAGPGGQVALELGLEHRFIEIDNPA